ncbi:hypothetical protein LX16_1099 [Stackebrandtia albiflava]|uniref:Uncharacterized protein n=1 Tax=Stackebrandtia albiflava TaxID=406432 RepID=A0A562VBZ8_9ACTN|nr:hypothetical protein [Stackebrandtia albiflava]TWJ15396.1 hypothetical protein LX16_1099 [Stackebrandtia albiflava]
MGDWFQSITDLDAEVDEAGPLAESITAWLVSVTVISAERTDCVLGADLGHPPGPGGSAVVEEPDLLPWGSRTNGVSIHIGRKVFTTVDEDSRLVCPGCHRVGEWRDARGDESAQAARFSEVLTDWLGGGGSRLDCLGCGLASRLNDWRWSGTPWAFAALGLTFWNWPSLRPDFVTEFGHRLGGHRIRSVSGKL